MTAATPVKANGAHVRMKRHRIKKKIKKIHDKPALAKHALKAENE